MTGTWTRNSGGTWMQQGSSMRSPRFLPSQDLVVWPISGWSNPQITGLTKWGWSTMRSDWIPSSQPGRNNECKPSERQQVSQYYGRVHPDVIPGETGNDADKRVFKAGTLAKRTRNRGRTDGNSKRNGGQNGSNDCWIKTRFVWIWLIVHGRPPMAWNLSSLSLYR